MIQSSASLETTIAILACCRMGITHNVIFEDLEKSGVARNFESLLCSRIAQRQPGPRRQREGDKYSSRLLC